MRVRRTKKRTMSNAIADGLMALRSAMDPTKHAFVWDELTRFADATGLALAVRP
jgi:hypothetical protein